MEDFATTMLADLHRYLVRRGAVDEHLPECPDVEAKWPPVAEAYLPDGAREFANYPIASLGWMMFIGMAIAKRWDQNWEQYSQIDDLYTPMRDKRAVVVRTPYWASVPVVYNTAKVTCVMITRIKPITPINFISFILYSFKLKLYSFGVDQFRVIREGAREDRR